MKWGLFVVVLGTLVLSVLVFLVGEDTVGLPGLWILLGGAFVGQHALDGLPWRPWRELGVAVLAVVLLVLFARIVGGDLAKAALCLVLLVVPLAITRGLGHRVIWTLVRFEGSRLQASLCGLTMCARDPDDRVRANIRPYKWRVAWLCISAPGLPADLIVTRGSGGTTGDASFDARFRVRGAPGVIRARLDDPTRRALLALDALVPPSPDWTSVALELYKGTLTVRTRGMWLTRSRAKALIEALEAAAAALREDAPG